MLWQGTDLLLINLIRWIHSFLRKFVKLRGTFTEFMVVFHHRTEKVKHFVISQLGLQFLNKNFE